MRQLITTLYILLHDFDKCNALIASGIFLMC